MKCFSFQSQQVHGQQGGLSHGVPPAGTSAQAPERLSPNSWQVSLSVYSRPHPATSALAGSVSNGARVPLLERLYRRATLAGASPGAIPQPKSDSREPASVRFSSVAQSCPDSLRPPWTAGHPGFPVHHQLPEFTETHVHQGYSTLYQFSFHCDSLIPYLPSPMSFGK